MKLWIGTSLLLLAAESALGQINPITPQSLAIKLSTPKSLPESKKFAYLESWKKACITIGRYLMVEQGLQGTGVFKDFTCFYGKKWVAGTPASKVQAFSWYLLVKDQEKVDLSIYYLKQFGMSRKLLRQSLVRFRGSDKTMAVISDPEVAGLLALRLVKQLPMQRAIHVKNELPQQIIKKDRLRRSHPIPIGYKSLDLYSLTFDTRTDKFIPTLVGSARNLSQKISYRPKDPKQFRSFRQTHRYRLQWQQKRVRHHQTYWAQASTGRDGDAKSEKAALEFVLSRYDLSSDTFLQALMDTVAQGYVGGRIGLPVVRGEDLQSKSQLYSLFAEVRGGPLKGFRWIWDFFPRTEQVVDGEKLHFEWSRPSFGWSLGYELEGLITRIDVLPKMGWMNMSARVGLQNPNGGAIIPQDLNLDYSFSLGIEVGIESQNKWFLTRLWGATDGSGLFNDLPGVGSVTSMRAGVDAYFDLFSLGTFGRFSLLVFAFGEQVALSFNPNDATSNEARSEAGVQVEGLTYALAYAGIGGTFAW